MEIKLFLELHCIFIQKDDKNWTLNFYKNPHITDIRKKLQSERIVSHLLNVRNI